MNADFLAVVKHSVEKMPIMLDKVPAPPDPEAGPFLITSSKDLIWIDRAFKGGFVRLGIRQSSMGELFYSMVEKILEAGLERGWDNSFPSTKAGVLGALARFRYYDLPMPSLLYGSEFDIGLSPNMDRFPVDWLPPRWGVLVPDREYVGTAFLLGDSIGAIVHNPSRGVVILLPPDPIETIFEGFPHVETITWDGEVRVNGEITGDPAIFEPLWDYFVDKSHSSHKRG